MELVEYAYCMSRDWHIQPSEFWDMAPTEFWWEFDAKLRLQQSMAEQVKRSEMRNGFSVGEWEDAKMKMKEARNG